MGYCSGQKVHLVCTGALTNAALLLILFPEVQQLLEQIVVMGGAVGSGNTNPVAEFNIQARMKSKTLRHHRATVHRKYYVNAGGRKLHLRYDRVTRATLFTHKPSSHR